MLPKHIVLYLTTEKSVNPGDITLAYDCGISYVVPCISVSLSDVKEIISETIFARGVDGAKYTLVFISGKNVDQIESMEKIAKYSMFKPYSHSVLVDANGSYSLAAATVAKIEQALTIKKKKIKNTKIAIIEGASLEGLMIARLCLDLKADVTLISKSPVDAEIAYEKLKAWCKKRPEKVITSSQSDLISAIKGADIIINTGPKGVMLLPKDAMEVLGNVSILVDLNQVPPPGISGVDLTDDLVKKGRTFTIGALVLRELRLAVQSKLIRQAILARGGGFFSYKDAYQVAKDLVMSF